jgi:hypothetical protein
MVQQTAHIAVHPGDHRRMALVLRRPVFQGVRPVVGHMSTIFQRPVAFVVRVRDDHAPIQKERPVLVIGDEGQRLVREQIVGVQDSVFAVSAAQIADRNQRIG